jgi:hypothetical protein
MAKGSKRTRQTNSTAKAKKSPAKTAKQTTAGNPEINYATQEGLEIYRAYCRSIGQPVD